MLTVCRSVLIAGAGLVSQPVGDILAKAGYQVIYGCRNIQTAQKTAAAVGSKASGVALDVHNAQQLSDAVAKCDLVVSLVPPPDHPHVIKAAIQHKKHVLTTSYVSPEVEALRGEAEKAGIVVMNELGLDPGLDHLWAVKVLQEVADAGGKCTNFESFCGGLPAPEASDNALGYRFSWSPAGVLRALNRVAKYVENGKDVEKAGVELMSSAKPFVNPYKGFALECYANGDSLPYRHRYPAMTEATGIIRGTLRYTGFADICKCLINIGFLDMEEKDFLKSNISWAEATSKIIGANTASEDALLSTITSKHKFNSEQEKDDVVRGLQRIGIFSKDPVTPPKESPSPFFALCGLLEAQGMYEEGQRDMILLQHTFHVTKKDGKKSIINAVLLEYGEPKGYSAMAKLVGVPAAVGCLAILDGKITTPGLVSPVEEKIAAPLRERLQTEFGIKCIESEIDA